MNTRLSRCMIPGKATLAAVIVAAASPLAAQSVPDFAADGFSVCVDPTFPPMEYMANAADKEPSGVDIDVARALAAHWGVAVSFVSMDFAGLLPSLEAGRCDAVISGTVLREDRLKTFNAVPYLDTSTVLIAGKGAPAVSDIAELAGKTVAVQSGTSYPGRMEALNAELEAAGLAPTKIQQYPKQSDAIQQLLVGRAAYVVTQDTEIAFRELEDPGKFDVVFTMPAAVFEPFSVYLRKDDAETAKTGEAVKALVENGELLKIVEKWNLSPSQLNGIGE
ncbi:transporter substrate-binding domain-containing protein [Pseudomonas sp. GX19020]|uniref:transporter substrate-binding domain-containing protein n=1 Tax=Pseudomonas sp. GX19020 TaxID=2942277 RepID=UPI002018FE55|nr:transporter substrate-binding domain-containing protein [Pseudomonas sp. GX19020]MCL4068971.1 transporter substrate-binding domain-containing protein [Pseudomonas sp. GX19020]